MTANADKVCRNQPKVPAKACTLALDRSWREQPTYGFFRCLRIAFQTCTRIFLVISWQPWLRSKETITDQKDPAQIKKNHYRSKKPHHRSERTIIDQKELAGIKNNLYRSTRTSSDHTVPSEIKKKELRSQRTITDPKEPAQITNKAVQITQNYRRSKRTITD